MWERVDPTPQTTHLPQTTLKTLTETFRNSLKMKEHLLNKVVNIVKKEKLIIMSNFSYCHNVFKSLLKRRKNAPVSGKELKLHFFSIADNVFRSNLRG